jgi:hypothetical protein
MAFPRLNRPGRVTRDGMLRIFGTTEPTPRSARLRIRECETRSLTRGFQGLLLLGSMAALASLS